MSWSLFSWPFGIITKSFHCANQPDWSVDSFKLLKTNVEDQETLRGGFFLDWLLVGVFFLVPSHSVSDQTLPFSTLIFRPQGPLKTMDGMGWIEQEDWGGCNPPTPPLWKVRKPISIPFRTEYKSTKTWIHLWITCEISSLLTSCC